MHPYVYKKQHNPFQFVLPVFIFIMILCPASYSSSCNVAVKNVTMYSPFSKGYIRIEGNKIKTVNSVKGDPNDSLFTVTIDKHYFLIYHIKSAKFICWNKNYTKLVAKRNPTNLAYCKFEDKISKLRSTYLKRYTTKNKNREVEIRVTKSGGFANPHRIRKCLKKHKLASTNKELNFFLKLDPSRIDNAKVALEAYRQLTERCASPEFYMLDATTTCTSQMPEFCAQMQILKNNGHNITQELMYLCKNEWNKSN